MTYSRQQHALMSVLAGIGLCGAVAAHADEGMSWKFSGFGTIGAVVTDTNEAEFRSSLRQPRGATKSSPDLGVDSRLGLQANVKINETFSAVGQLLTSRRDGTDRPQVEWLFAQAAVTPWLDLRAGRMVLPTFLLSDTRSVGYAQHWLRAPQEAYSLYPPSSFDGVMAHMRTNYAGFNFNLQLSAGKAEADIWYANLPLTAKYKEVYSVNLTVERGDWLARFGRAEGPDARLQLQANGMNVMPPNTDDAFTGLGLQYDNGKLLVISEYLTRRSTGTMIDSNNYYISSGYRFGTLMPYVTASRLVGRGIITNTSESTQAIGVRWDAMKNTALKAQFERTRLTSVTQFVNVTSPAPTDPKVNVLSVAVDFVF